MESDYIERSSKYLRCLMLINTIPGVIDKGGGFFEVDGMTIYASIFEDIVACKGIANEYSVSSVLSLDGFVNLLSLPAKKSVIFRYDEWKELYDCQM